MAESKKIPPKTKLKNKKHEMFCLEYVSCGQNATQAYRKIYPKSSKKASETHGARLVKNGKVRGRVAELLKEQEEKLKETLLIDAEGVAKGFIEEIEYCKSQAKYRNSFAIIAAYKELEKYTGGFKEEFKHTETVDDEKVDRRLNAFFERQQKDASKKE